MIQDRVAMIACGLAASLLVGACGSGNKADRDDDIAIDKPRVTTTQKDGYLAQYFDLDGDGNYDVVKHIESYQDPDNPDVTKRRIRKKKIDLNQDGTYDVHREYDQDGVIQREEVDNDLDGTADVINHFEGGSLKRKEIVADDGETVVTERIYVADAISKVKKDTDGDGKFDRWEFYKDGTLQRIGRDENADEKIDKWVHR